MQVCFKRHRWIDLSGVDVGSCQISYLIKFFIHSIYLAQEDDLAKTIKDFQVSKFPLTINRVCHLAFKICLCKKYPCGQ